MPLVRGPHGQVFVRGVEIRIFRARDTGVIRQQPKKSRRLVMLSAAKHLCAGFLYPEEQVADLVDYFGVSTRLTTWEALVGSEYKI